jgi:predicted nucleic acid-binding protein
VSDIVVADANVLVPAALCDFLLRAADAYLYQVRWTEDILDEVQRTLTGDLRRSAAQARRRIEAMKRAFPDAMITSHRHLIDTMTNSPKDRHVVAAAVEAGAQIIATSNLRDFPAESLSQYEIVAESPDEFLLRLLGQDTDAVVTIVRQQATGLRSPPMSPFDVLTALAPHAPRFAGQVSPLV